MLTIGLGQHPQAIFIARPKGGCGPYSRIISRAASGQASTSRESRKHKQKQGTTIIPVATGDHCQNMWVLDASEKQAAMQSSHVELLKRRALRKQNDTKRKNSKSDIDMTLNKPDSEIQTLHEQLLQLDPITIIRASPRPYPEPLGSPKTQPKDPEWRPRTPTGTQQPPPRAPRGPQKAI